MGTLALAFEIIAIDDASEKFRHIAKSAQDTHSGLDKLATYGKAALFGLGTSLIAVGGFSLKMADEFEVSHAKLEAALKANGTSFEELRKPIQAADKQMEKFGFTNADVEAALAQFTVSLKNPREGLKQMGLAADLAKFKNIPLADSALIVSKAMEGQLKPLKALGIDLPVAAGGALRLERAHLSLEKAQQKVKDLLVQFPDAANKASKAHKQYETAVTGVKDAEKKLSDQQGVATTILKALHERMDGQASTAAKTFRGRVEALKTEVENLATKIGLALIPWIERLIDATKNVVEWFGRHKTIAQTLAGVIGGALVIAIGTYIVTTIIATATTVSQTVAVVVANASFATFVVRYYAVIAASRISAIATGVWTGAQWLLNAALSANPIGLVIVAIAALVIGITIAWQHSQTFRDIVRSAFRMAADAVLGSVLAIMGVLESFYRAMGHIPGVGGMFRGVANEIHNARGAVQALKNVIDGLPTHKELVYAIRTNVETVYNSIQAAGSTSSPTTMKMRAGGGSINAGEVYRVGERESEFFVSDKAGQILNQRQARAAGLTGGSGRGDTHTWNLTTSADPVAIAHEQAWLMKVGAL